MGLSPTPNMGFVSMLYPLTPVDVPKSEYIALVNFYWATGGPSWTNSTNWLTDTTIGDWYGITVAGGHVTGLSLANNNIVGDVGNFLTQLTSITTSSLTLNANASLAVDISLLPPNMTSGSIYLGSTSAYGDIADLPSGLTSTIQLQNTAVSECSSSTWPCNTGNSKTLDFDDLSMSATSVDNILVGLDAHGNTGCTLDLTGNGIPTATGLAAKTNLEGKGWTVSVAS